MNNKIKTFCGEMTFDKHHCFLCGTKMSADSISEEHIFPKWLLNRNNLWNLTLTLLNKSKIPYKNLKVPCCKQCNNVHLSIVEKEVRNSFENGINGVNAIDKKILIKWIIKILYSLLYKQLYLKNNIKDKNSESIMTPEILKRYQMLFDYLQCIIKDIDFDETFASIFVFEIIKQPSDIGKENFFYVDDVKGLQFAIRTNEIGIICTLGDNGAIKRRLNSYLEPFYNIPVNEVQFRQIIADVFYSKSLLKNKQSMIITPQMIQQIQPFQTLFDEYNNKQYAEVLFNMQGGIFNFEDLYSEKYDAALNFLIDRSDNIVVYNEDGTYQTDNKHPSPCREVFEEVLIGSN